jgi:hypothetical protein
VNAHPINLALRFLLELIALGVTAYWGWQRGGEGPSRFVLGLAVPLIAALIWGTFRVPNDPGAAPVPIPGLARLALELAFFGFAAWALHDLGLEQWGWALSVIVIIHYLISYDRVFCIIKQ